MKKYKLIKEYPGSDAKGTIAVLLETKHIYKGFRFNYSTKHVENSPEYWEEVVEKDYEILKYHSIENPSIGRTTCNSKLNDTYNIYSVKRLSDGEIFTIGDKISVSEIGISDTITEIVLADSINWNDSVVKKRIFLGCKNSNSYILSSVKKVIEKDYQILKSCPIEGTIYSVERLSDGEVFTLGDRIKVYQHGSIKTIDSIDLYGNTSSMKEGIWFRYNTGSCHMTHIIKQKPQPIYLTHDGKDIFPEDTVWYVNKENFYHDYIKAYPEVKFNSEIRAYFLTQEEAKNYIIENAKALSINDFWEFVCWGGSTIAKSKRLKRLVKERLNLK